MSDCIRDALKSIKPRFKKLINFNREAFSGEITLAKFAAVLAVLGNYYFFAFLVGYLDFFRVPISPTFEEAILFFVRSSVTNSVFTIASKALVPTGAVLLVSFLFPALSYNHLLRSLYGITLIGLITLWGARSSYGNGYHFLISKCGAGKYECLNKEFKDRIPWVHIPALEMKQGYLIWPASERSFYIRCGKMQAYMIGADNGKDISFKKTYGSDVGRIFCKF